MVLSRFFGRVRDYGIRSILFDIDMKFSLLIWGMAVLWAIIPCETEKLNYCISLYSEQLIDHTIRLFTMLTALIITGLSILVAFTDKEFVSDLKSLGVYSNIMFVFEYTFFLTATTALVGILMDSYPLPGPIFYLYLFLLIYAPLSIANLIQLVVDIGIKKAEYESVR